ncbi:hotdog fold thioesterase [Nesterenkonia sp. HG001]|uniref:hotdog fold thioesterase n=1 Tax=Nesterenkonia sp. HG001 TaxID=2983207 RepID=UPI002AC68634|nr:hotdog fold thioesterase [Nesterenkonia sp. HG001]MDZ5078038.1 hotdog fold thioesterase [Nesterenkonia sp. HG001]
MSGDFTARTAPEAHLRPDPSQIPDEAERTARLRAAGVPEELHGMMGPHGVAPLGQKMGLRFEEMAPERLVATLPVAGNEQNMGLFHGGAHMVLAETLGSLAAILHVRLTLELVHPVVGIELGATHHRAVTDGVVTGTCTPINLGRTLTSHEIVMRDEQGRRLSTARMTNMILTPRE